MDSLELDVWCGDWGLPSIDHHCLSVMAYSKFSDVPMQLTKCNNPWKSPTGELPVLKHDGDVETKVTEIFNHLRKHNWGLDHDLSSKQCADIVAFAALLEEKLVPAMLHLWWVDSKTYLEFTRPWFSKQLPFPLNFYLPTKKHNDYVNYLNQLFTAQHLTETEREQKLYHDGKECLNLLSSKLGDKEYFFGDSPSSLDALVFGYLAPLLKAPFPSMALQNHLKACPNLCQLCQRILNKHFPLTQKEQEELRIREEENKQQQAETTEFPHRRRNMMVAGAVALTAMLGYAFFNGLIVIENVVQEKPYKDSISSHRGSSEYDEVLDNEDENINNEDGGGNRREHHTNDNEQDG